MLRMYYGIKLHAHHHFYKNVVLLCKVFWSDELYPYIGMPFQDLQYLRQYVITDWLK